MKEQNTSCHAEALSQSPEVIVPLCKVVKNTTSGIPETHIQQNNPIIFTQQNSLLSAGFTALTPLCTVSETVQSIPSVPTCSVAVGAHSSMTDSEQHNTLPFTSQNIPPASLPHKAQYFTFCSLTLHLPLHKLVTQAS
ncbi:hypothetical protein LguiA_012880 [Lonicera macranthoides]